VVRGLRDDSEHKEHIVFQLLGLLLLLIILISIIVSCKFKKAIYVGLFTNLVMGIVLLFRIKDFSVVENLEE